MKEKSKLFVVKGATRKLNTPRATDISSAVIESAMGLFSLTICADEHALPSYLRIGPRFLV